MKLLRPKYILVTGIVLFVLVFIGFAYVRYQGDPLATLVFPNTSMHYEIVTTLAQQEKGLGGRKTIPDNYGMLFVFPQKDRYGFWMKDMLVPIDIIWLADDGTITKIDANVDPSTYPTPYYPPVPVQYVLETRAGFASVKGWQVGTQIPLPTTYATNDK